MHFENKPGRHTALQAAHSHMSQLRPRGSFHQGSPLQKACPQCARRHTGELEEIRGEQFHKQMVQYSERHTSSDSQQESK